MLVFCKTAQPMRVRLVRSLIYGILFSRRLATLLVSDPPSQLLVFLIPSTPYTLLEKIKDQA